MCRCELNFYLLYTDSFGCHSNDTSLLIQGAHIKAIPNTNAGWKKNALRAALRKKSEEG